jgi:hypothetical protein
MRLTIMIFGCKYSIVQAPASREWEHFCGIRIIRENLRQWSPPHHKPRMNRSSLNLTNCGEKPMTEIGLSDRFWDPLLCCGFQYCFYKSNKLWWFGLGWDMWGLRVQFPTGMRDFPFSTACNPALSPPSLLYNMYQGLKQQGLEADHSTSPSAKVKSDGSSPYVFMVWCIVECRNYFPLCFRSHSLLELQTDHGAMNGVETCNK